MAGEHGGRRPGSGRKPKSAVERSLDGNAGHRGRVLTHPSAASIPAVVLPTLDEADAPNELSMEERRVWLELAPFALANGTLTDATNYGFRLLCRNIVLERGLSADPETRGASNHRGIIQRIDAELLRFNLAPCGKPVNPGAGVEQPAADPRKAKYFGGGRGA